jgi:putative FmdB family regulatory protein
MPIYDFKCKSCGYITELMRKVSDANITACPQCKQGTFEKMLSAPSFQLTGSGWYATDFKTKTKTSAEPASAESKSEAPAPASCAPGCACH